MVIMLSERSTGGMQLRMSRYGGIQCEKIFGSSAGIEKKTSESGMGQRVASNTKSLSAVLARGAWPATSSSTTSEFLA